jgi:hypothetical protein
MCFADWDGKPIKDFIDLMFKSENEDQSEKRIILV